CPPGPHSRSTSPASAARPAPPSPADPAGHPSARPAPRIGTSRRAHPPQVVVERLARDPLVRLAVPRRGLVDDLVGQRGGWRFVVPSARVQPVPDVLLVERRLAVAGLVRIRRPEPG